MGNETFFWHGLNRRKNDLVKVSKRRGKSLSTPRQKGKSTMEWNISPSCPVFRGLASFMGFPNSCQDPLLKNILEAGAVPLALRMRSRWHVSNFIFWRHDREGHRRFFDRLGQSRNSREILVILRLSVADATTLCLSFKNCTVAIFFAEYPFIGVWYRRIRWQIRFHLFFPPPEGGILVVFRIWQGKAPLFGLFATVMRYIVYFHDMYFSNVCFVTIHIYSAHLLQYTGWRTPIIHFSHLSLVSVVRIPNFWFASIVAEFSYKRL